MTRLSAWLLPPGLPVLLFSLLLLGGGAARAEEPGEFVATTLDNGLQVSILPDPASSLVATQVWYRVGSANEGPTSRGFAHLFEHLMFGDTKNHARNDYAELHHRCGGYENAYTSFDETVYQSELFPAQHRTLLEMEADRMVNLVLDQDTLDNEKRIVAEEIRVSLENEPFSRVLRATLREVLRDHPYAHAPAGTREDVAAATLEHCRSFYRTYYRPGNAHLVVVGPVDAETTLAAVREIFGPLPAGGETPPDVPAVNEVELPTEVVISEDLPPVEIAALAFVTPPAGSDRHWALAVLGELLGGGSVDPFAERLVKERRKALFAQTVWIGGRRGGTIAFVSASLPYRRKTTAFRLMQETIDELAGLDWLSDERLASAKRSLLRKELQRAYFPDLRAEAIGRAAWWLGDAQLGMSADEHLAAVSRDDVASAFRSIVAEAQPVRIYLRPRRVPLLVRLFGWLYPLVQG